MIDAQSDTLAGTRNLALLSLGYSFLARRFELVAIRSNDLKFTKDGALKGMIRKSKTDQYGRGRLVFGSDRSAKLVGKWLRLKPEEIQPVFCAINHEKCKERAICERTVNDIIKSSVVKWLPTYPEPPVINKFIFIINNPLKRHIPYPYTCFSKLLGLQKSLHFSTKIVR